jgi:transcriptional regulator with XRE-family HTH domain
MEAKSTPTKKDSVSPTWQVTRNGDTFTVHMTEKGRVDPERGERVKEIRKRVSEREGRHITQDALADRLGVTLRAYQLWESGRGIDPDNAIRLAMVGQVSLDWLMQGETQNGSNHLNASEEPNHELVARLREIEEVLRESEAGLDALRSRVDQLRADVLAELRALRSSLESQARQTRSPKES